jgi:adenylate kinase
MGFLFQKSKPKPPEPHETKPLPETPSIPETNVETAKEDLRILKIEKEIVGFALSRFDTAEAEGKITQEDRVYLLEKYSQEMKKLEKTIKRKELIIRLHDLEHTQSNLIQLFQEKLDELNKDIKQIQSSLPASTEPR